MSCSEKIKIDDVTIQTIETVLSKGDRVEIIPVKDGVKILKVKRETVKTNACRK